MNTSGYGVLNNLLEVDQLFGGKTENAACILRSDTAPLLKIDPNPYRVVGGEAEMAGSTMEEDMEVIRMKNKLEDPYYLSPSDGKRLVKGAESLPSWEVSPDHGLQTGDIVRVYRRDTETLAFIAGAVVGSSGRVFVQAQRVVLGGLFPDGSDCTLKANIHNVDDPHFYLVAVRHAYCDNAACGQRGVEGDTCACGHTFALQ